MRSRVRPLPNSFVSELASRWIAIVIRRPLLVVLLVAVLSAASAFYAANQLRLESDVTQLVDPTADFLVKYGTYKATFPQHRRLNVVVIDGADARAARQAESSLLVAMRARPELFREVFAPGSDPFLVRHALLFLETDALSRLVDRLAEAQPALAIVARDPSLRGFAELFDTVLADGRTGTGDARLARLVVGAARNLESPDVPAVSWAELALGSDAVPARRLIVFQGSLEDDDERIARAQAEAIRGTVQRERLETALDVTVRMTGRGPLSAAELESALSSIRLAGLLSLSFVVVLLWVGLGSGRAIVAAVATLAAGLSLTAGFAAIAVGSLNVLSLTFAVLFIGLGIDFAIHMILRRTGEGGAPDGDWDETARGLGPTLSLCGLTTAIAFLAFWPTGFRGLGELGLISAAGIAIAVVLTFTVLPPLLDLLKVRTVAGRPAIALPRWFAPARMVMRMPGPVSLAAIVLLVAATAVGLQLRFDFNSLNLQDPDSEAVQTLVSLHEDGTVTPYSLTVAAPDMAAAERIATDLRSLPDVADVRTLRDFVPEDQQTKLALIDEARILLGPAVLNVAPVAPPDEDARTAALARLIAAARTAASRPGADPAFADMAAALERVRGTRDLERLEARLTDDVPDSLALVRSMLSAGPVRAKDLPDDLVARETGVDGSVRVVALPRDDLRDFEALEAFVRAVHTMYPDATGRPALEAGVGEIVVAAFRQAFATAALAILIVLLVMLRSLRDALLVMMPLLLAAALTSAAMVVLAIPLNVANVIVLPLLLGLGVDNGIHIFGRYRETGSVADVYGSSTPRAVVTSALTTLLSFVALAFAEHRGMASMGLLLAVAIGFMLFTTLIVLPALLAWRDRTNLQ